MFKKAKSVSETEGTPFLFDLLDRSSLERPLRGFSSDQSLSDTPFYSHHEEDKESASQINRPRAPEPLFKSPHSNAETVIGPSVQIKGLLIFERSLKIDGFFEGQLLGQGKIHIGQRGQVKAHLTEMDEVIIEGTLEGNVVAAKRVELKSKAKVNGDITAPAMTIEEGAIVIGKVNIIPLDTHNDSDDPDLSQMGPADSIPE